MSRADEVDPQVGNGGQDHGPVLARLVAAGEAACRVDRQVEAAVGAETVGHAVRLVARHCGIKNKLGQFDQHFTSQAQSAAQQTVQMWAKDKPQYDKVKFLMGQLIQSGAAKRRCSLRLLHAGHSPVVQLPKCARLISSC